MKSRLNELINSDLVQTEAYGQQDTSSLKQIMLNLKEPSTQEETKTYKKQYNEKPIDSTVQARRNRAEILYKLLLDNKLVSQTISQMFCGDAHIGFTRIQMRCILQNSQLTSMFQQIEMETQIS